ncbi:J domain-containing protein [Mesorhizobium sp. ES1-4]|uniref:J domain-containing protein n=1 Tax=Mesorhizobium sp. ES1-4 TaxID=2876627 RepID=UPI001CD005CB|nr:DnaJ domain-containing protein [Mesorhizobium sp. ES1-4]MBZ9798328.1 DnaJ domain-containing protein [Mesorhizobium sp. ES1-4]
MARRRKNDDGATFVIGAVVIVGIVVLTILLTATVFAPAILMVAFAVYQLKAGTRPMVEEPHESELLNLSTVEEELAAKIGRLEEIEEVAFDADLMRNADYSFHRGSRLGKQLNAEIESLGPRVSELQRLAGDVRAAPLASFQQWVHVTAMRSAIGRTLVVYLAIFAGSYWLVMGPWKDLGAFTARHVLFHAGNMSEVVYGAAFVSGLSSTIVLYLVYRSRTGRILSEHAEIAQRWTEFASFEVSPTKEIADEEVYEEDVSSHQHRSVLDDAKRAWHEVLGVSSRASADEINAAYRAKMMKNHPDKVAELDDEFRQLAESRAKMLNWARDEGIQASG